MYTHMGILSSYNDISHYYDCIIIINIIIPRLSGVPDLRLLLVLPLSLCMYYI